MLRQYLDIKAECKDALLMFRLGDFYELFFDDAVTASEALDITLTGRDAGEAGRIPMCGVPFHAVDQYLSRLVEQGYRVAVCDQLEDPKEAKGLVKRDIVRIVTPGTWLSDGSAENRYLGCLMMEQGEFGAALVDVGTGEVWTGSLKTVSLVREWLAHWRPVELLLDESYEVATEYSQNASACITLIGAAMTQSDGVEMLISQFDVKDLSALGISELDGGTNALAHLIQYVRDTQKSALVHLQRPRRFFDSTVLLVDESAVNHLELTQTVRTRQRKGSLLGLLDDTRTAMGARMLRQFILRPLANVTLIRERLEAISALCDDVFLREFLRESLRAVYDLDRILARFSLGSANARDMLSLGKSLLVLPELMAAISSSQSALLVRTATGAPDCGELAESIVNTLVDNPPASVRDGGIIRDGVDAILDQYRSANVEGKSWIAALEQRERERTGIKSLKVGYNKVFGYYIEVSKANLHLVPEDYARRQTLASAERFVLPEMKERESLILEAQEKQVEREYELFMGLVDAVMSQMDSIQDLSRRIALQDALQSLATVAVRERYVMPEVSQTRGIHIVKGRHPVVEAANPGKFVPNDVRLDSHQHFLLITGPNMAGKSTYMRQIALIVLMAHMGSFVPAEAAAIGLVDRIFTRIGASDNLAAGQSTFMVEMVELAQILREATDKSLVLLDEIGRGTSTYDGLSIAEAVMEALNQPGRSPLTLFATHYHELTKAADAIPGTANLSVLVEENGRDIQFLHSVVNRPADKSYGIQVARLAGLPATVIERATELLATRETGQAYDAREAYGGRDSDARPDVAATMEPPLAKADERKVVTLAVQHLLARITDIEVQNMTPLEAMNVLWSITEEAKEALSWG